MNALLKADIVADAKGKTPIHAARTILVVDDSLHDIELLQLMFKRSRILNPLQAVNNVHEAICYLKGEGIRSDREKYPLPTLMLLDLHLPDGSGFDVLRWVQAHKPESPVGVVILTGSNVHAIKQAYDLGAHSFLVKPLKFHDFQNMVEHVRGIKLTDTGKGHLLEVE